MCREERVTALFRPPRGRAISGQRCVSSRRRPLASRACRPSHTLSHAPHNAVSFFQLDFFRLTYLPSNHHVPSLVLGLRPSPCSDDPPLPTDPASFVPHFVSFSLICLRRTYGGPRSSTCLPTGTICPPLRLHCRSHRSSLVPRHRVQRFRCNAQSSHFLDGECRTVGIFNDPLRWIVGCSEVQNERMGSAL